MDCIETWHQKCPVYRGAGCSTTNVCAYGHVCLVITHFTLSFCCLQEKSRRYFFSLFYFSINAGSVISTLLTPVLRGTASEYPPDMFQGSFQRARGAFNYLAPPETYLPPHTFILPTSYLNPTLKLTRSFNPRESNSDCLLTPPEPNN